MDIVYCEYCYCFDELVKLFVKSSIWIFGLYLILVFGKCIYRGWKIYILDWIDFN